MALKVTPVPIPNTKVKLQCADGTAGVTLWKSRLSPGYHSSLAQLVEQRTENPRVRGSIPGFHQKVKDNFQLLEIFFIYKIING